MKIEKGYRLAGLIGCALVLAVGGVIYFQKHSSPVHLAKEPDSVDGIIETMVDNTTSANRSLPRAKVSSASVDNVKFSTVLTTDVSNMNLPDKKALIQSRRDKIEVLMAELDKSHDDPDELKRIDAEIKRYIANYNQLLLPVIVAEQEFKK